ncbi:MAG TPA: hypothetical protein VHD69_02325 [Candidatus Paceibacterota bacterium]|nr:hypothetical protein [Candidatus Paceibacterota bacterium]
MGSFLQKDKDGVLNTIPPIPPDRIKDVNCHKFVLYVLGQITWDEMISDSHAQKKAGLDFTYGEKARAISNKEFVPIANIDSLIKLADECCDHSKTCIGQIMDKETGEMAHSFIIEKILNGEYQCFDKQGFKHYPFSVHGLESFLDFVNEKGEKSYQNQKWRFVPIESST